MKLFLGGLIMKAINLDEIRIKNGLSIYELIKSLINESNFSDEDFEYEIPTKKRKYYHRDKYSK